MPQWYHGRCATLRNWPTLVQVLDEPPLPEPPDELAGAAVVVLVEGVDALVDDVVVLEDPLLLELPSFLVEL